MKDIAEEKGYTVVEACLWTDPCSTRQRGQIILANLLFSAFLPKDL